MSSTSFQGDTSVSPSRGQLLKVIPAVPDHLGTGSPGKRWNPHPGMWWSPMWTWHSGTRVSGDRGGAGGMVELHLGELSRPSWLHDSSLVLREHAHTGKFNGNTSRRGIPVGTLVGGFPSFQSSSELGFPGFHLLLMARPIHGIMETAQAEPSCNCTEQIHGPGKRCSLWIPLEAPAFQDTKLPHHAQAWDFREGPL